MDLRAAFTDQVKLAMKSGDHPRLSTLRMVTAKLKDADIAARPQGPISHDAIVAMLRGMVKSRRESIALYQQGNRPELAAKEAAEIAVIEAFLPSAMDPAALREAVTEAIAQTRASSVKDMGRVMAALKERHGGAMDLAAAGPLVRAALAA